MPPPSWTFRGPAVRPIAQGRNDGAKTARGNFFIFLDADCVIPEPDRFFSQALSQFRKYPNLVALTAYLRVFPREETFGDKLVHGVANLGLRFKKQCIQPQRVV